MQSLLLIFYVLVGISQGFITPNHPLLLNWNSKHSCSTFNYGPRSCSAGVPVHNTKGVHKNCRTTLLRGSNEINRDTISAVTPKSDAVETNTSTKSDASTPVQTVASTLLLVTIDVALRRYFRSAGISFPSSLAGCGILFASLIILSAINASWGDGVYGLFSPGAALLAKWLAVFFVPSLVTLPLAQSLGSSLEIAKVFFVVIFGFLITLTTTSFSVLGIRRITEGNTQDTIPKSSPVDAVPQAKKPTFSSSTLTTLISFATLSSIVSLVSSIIGLNSSIPKIAKTLLMLSSTLASFVFGARLPPKVTKVVHPLVTCTSITWIVTKLLSLTTKTQFVDQLRLYRTGKLASLTTTGAGDILLFMLGPSVVALACQMYNRRTIMRKNIKEVATAVIVGSTAGGLFGTALLVRLVNLASSTITLSLLPRNITSPLAMAIATLLGGADVSLAVSMVVVSGLLGANFGASILDKVGIHDPVARGLGIGAAAHGLGTAAFANEPDAFPFSAIAMALTASLSTVLVSVPLIRRTLIKIALGH